MLWRRRWGVFHETTFARNRRRGFYLAVHEDILWLQVAVHNVELVQVLPPRERASAFHGAWCMVHVFGDARAAFVFAVSKTMGALEDE